jgi:hypothetical protein
VLLAPGAPAAGAEAWIGEAREALQAAAGPGLPLAAHPAYAAAAGRLWGALDEMAGGLVARDPRFFVALRDGSRALVELRTVAEGLAARRAWKLSATGGTLGSAAEAAATPDAEARLADLTAAFRQLRGQFGAEELRHQAGAPLRAAERRHLARLAAAARAWNARVRQVEAAARGARQAGFPPLDPVLLAELRRLALLLDRIGTAPATLEGYLNALTRTDVALGTWVALLDLRAAGWAAGAAGSPDAGASASGGEASGSEMAEADAAGIDASGAGAAGLEGNGADASGGANPAAGALAALAPAGDELANNAGVGFVFAADLDSGKTWSYLKQGGSAVGAATLWTGGSGLDPFAEFDEGSQPLDVQALASPPREAPAEGEQLASPALPASGTGGEELARRFGGRFEDGRVVIQGNPAGDLPAGEDLAAAGALAAAGGFSASESLPAAEAIPASEGLSDGEPGGFASASADLWAADEPELDWLAGAPQLCSPLPPRCGPEK